jgi:cation diffusion facilitator family transporter
MYEYTIGKDLKSTAIQGDAMHHLSDAITTGVALVGTLLALYGGTYWARATDYAAICAAMYMAYNAYAIGYPALRELLDESVYTDMETAVHTVASGIPGVTNINTCIVRKSGFDYIVELHIQVDGDISVRDGHLVAHRVEDTVCIAYPSIQKMVIHVEPRWDIV